MNPKNFHRYKTFVARFVFSVLLVIGYLPGVSQNICDNATSGVFGEQAKLLAITENNDCTIDITVAPRRSTNERTPACFQPGALAEICQNGFLACINNCYKYSLFINNVLVENTCSDNDQFTFTNVATQGQFKVVVEYRHRRICNGEASICFTILDKRLFTVNVCSQINNLHNNNQPALIKRQEQIIIDCAIQDNKTTILQSAIRIRALPGASSGTGPNTFFHAFIAPCPNGKKGDDDNNDVYIAETTSEEKPVDEPKENDINTATDITIHPNPTSGEFTIHVTGDVGQGTSEVYIYDIFGRLIYKSEIVNRQSELVNISQHPKGIYLVKVLSGEEISIKKLIHQ